MVESGKAADVLVVHVHPVGRFVHVPIHVTTGKAREL